MAVHRTRDLFQRHRSTGIAKEIKENLLGKIPVKGGPGMFDAAFSSILPPNTEKGLAWLLDKWVYKPTSAYAARAAKGGMGGLNKSTASLNSGPASQSGMQLAQQTGAELPVTRTTSEVSFHDAQATPTASAARLKFGQDSEFGGSNPNFGALVPAQQQSQQADDDLYGKDVTRHIAIYSFISALQSVNLFQDKLVAAEEALAAAMQNYQEAPPGVERIRQDARRRLLSALREARKFDVGRRGKDDSPSERARVAAIRQEVTACLVFLMVEVTDDLQSHAKVLEEAVKPAAELATRRQGLLMKVAKLETTLEPLQKELDKRKEAAAAEAAQSPLGRQLTSVDSGVGDAALVSVAVEEPAAGRGRVSTTTQGGGFGPLGSLADAARNAFDDARSLQPRNPNEATDRSSEACGILLEFCKRLLEDPVATKAAARAARASAQIARGSRQQGDDAADDADDDDAEDATVEDALLAEMPQVVGRHGVHLFQDLDWRAPGSGERSVTMSKASGSRRVGGGSRAGGSRAGERLRAAAEASGPKLLMDSVVQSVMGLLALKLEDTFDLEEALKLEKGNRKGFEEAENEFFEKFATPALPPSFAEPSVDAAALSPWWDKLDTAVETSPPPNLEADLKKMKKGTDKRVLRAVAHKEMAFVGFLCAVARAKLAMLKYDFLSEEVRVLRERRAALAGRVEKVKETLKKIDAKAAAVAKKDNKNKGRAGAAGEAARPAAAAEGGPAAAQGPVDSTTTAPPAAGDGAAP